MKRNILKREEGQSMVVVSLLVVSLLAFMGLLVDGGRVFSARRQSQNASDAGAFAGARALTSRTGNGAAVDHSILTTINTYAMANGATSESDIQAYYMYQDNTQGTLVGSGIVPGGATGVRVLATIHLQPFFISVLNGNTPIDTQTTATMQSGLLTNYNGFMPMTVKYQPFTYGQLATLMGDKTGPGNFQWLDFSWPCKTPSEQDLADAMAIPPPPAPEKEADPDHNFMDPDTDPGGKHWICGGPGVKGAVSPLVQEWLDLPEDDRHWIIPVYDTFQGSGSNMVYHIVAFAEFIPIGYDFGGNKQFPPGYTCPPTSGPANKCLEGKFVKFTVPGHGDTGEVCNTDGSNGCAIWLSQ